MKKIYFTPDMEIIGVETEQQMLATSLNLYDDEQIDASESLAPGMEASDDDFDF